MWKTQVNTFPKADTYKLFKNTVKFESYLTDIKTLGLTYENKVINMSKFK